MQKENVRAFSLFTATHSQALRTVFWCAYCY